MDMINLVTRTIYVPQLQLAIDGCYHGALADEATWEHAEQMRLQTDGFARYYMLNVASHELAKRIDPREVLTTLQARFPRAQDYVFEEVLAEAEAIADAVLRRHNGPSSEPALMTWHSKRFNWTIIGEVFRVDRREDEHGEFVQVTILKFTSELRRRHINNMRLLGLLAFMNEYEATKQEPRVKLVVESMLAPTSHFEFLNDFRVVNDLLERVGAALAKIEKIARKRTTPQLKTGDNCFSCPIRNGCSQGILAMDRIVAETRAAGETLPAFITHREGRGFPYIEYPPPTSGARQAAE